MGKNNNGLLFETEEPMYEDDFVQEPDWRDPSYQYDVEYEPEPEKIYSVTLADGTVISDLHLNGNNFVSQEPITESIFDGSLSEVIINDGEIDEVHTNMELIQITQMGDEYWFILADIPKERLVRDQMRADIDYIAMMTDVEF